MKLESMEAVRNHKQQYRTRTEQLVADCVAGRRRLGDELRKATDELRTADALGRIGQGEQFTLDLARERLATLEAIADRKVARCA